MKFLLPLGLLVTWTNASTIQKRAVSGTAHVYLNQNIGVPTFLASGFINGIPAADGQIPDHFYTDIKLQWARNSGGQIFPAGWTAGIDGYNARFASAIHDYHVATTHGGKFMMPLHNLWGFQNNIYPGDNGNWTEYDVFLTHLVSDWKKAGAGPTTGLITELWNEADLHQATGWNRTQEQWLQMWGHGYYKLKSLYPGLQIVGPTHANGPSTSNTWWTNWAAFVAQNGSIPDMYCWHFESGSGNLAASTSTLQSILTSNGLPSRQLIIDEYAAPREQTPSGGAWYIAQLERYNVIGLRANWFSGAGPLHDYMAGLVGKPNAGTSLYNETQAGYWPTAEFQVYKYYAQEMTGYRVKTAATADYTGEVYATGGNGKVRILTGARGNTGTWAITISGLDSIGFPVNGTISMKTLTFPGESNEFAEYDAPTDLGTVSHAYTFGTLTISKSNTEIYAARAQEFNLP